MKTIALIFWKEFKGYFNSPIAYIFIIAFLVFSNWLFFKGFFLMNQASMRAFFSLLPWIFLFLAPAITMRSWAEEKKLGTIELLMTLPVRDYELVIGKFLAGFIFLMVTLVCTLPMPLTIILLGSPDVGPIWGGYLGAFFMGGAYLAIGLLASSFTENQIVAFIVAIFLSFMLLVIGENLVLLNLPYVLVPIFSYLGLGAHFESIGRGVIDSRDLIYYLTVIGFFLFLNVLSVESRKWK